MLADWKDTQAIHYNKNKNNFIFNYGQTIVDTICILEHKDLYSIKKAYYIDSNRDFQYAIYSTIYSNFTTKTDRVIYNGCYPNKVAYNLEDIDITDTKVVNIIKKAIISMYKFNLQYNTDIYLEDINYLRGLLDEYDAQLLDIDLKKVIKSE